MQKEEKERVVAELTERLRVAETLIVADYRGLTMPQIDKLRARLVEQGVRFSVVKNTLTRRAAEAAGSEALLALLEGPTAIAFIETDGDAVAVAKAFADSARETRVLAVRGGVMQGRVISASDVEELAKLPALDVLRGQVLAAVIAPLSAIAALINAPLQNLVGLIDARIEQLGGAGQDVPQDVAQDVVAEPDPAAEAEPAADPEPAAEAEPATDAEAESAPAAEAEPAADEPENPVETENQEA